jgi:hypothetical protein
LTNATRDSNQNGQGAKPEKVNYLVKEVPWIAETRNSTPYRLISHHHTMIFILLKIYRS